ncbi:MAG: ABC transporter ATP-binding protein, partial [Pseudomonadota bacterium]
MTITLTNIRSGYEGFHLADISLEIAQGSLTALIGPNGCGKSTLLKTIAGFLPPGGGTVNIAGQDITKQRRNTVAKSIAVLPQQPIVPPGVTVDQLIGYGRAPYQNLLGIRSVEDHTAIEEALKAVDLTELGDRRLSDL